MTGFTFYSDDQHPILMKTGYVFSVKKNIQSKNQLLNNFSTGLSFPSYFGKNWDALYDCLTDLTWIEANKIIIIHEDIPLTTLEPEQKTYIQLLSDVTTSWKNHEGQQLTIAFPNGYQNIVDGLLQIGHLK